MITFNSSCFNIGQPFGSVFKGKQTVSFFFGGGGWGLMILLAGELFVYFNGGILRND